MRMLNGAWGAHADVDLMQHKNSHSVTVQLLVRGILWGAHDLAQSYRGNLKSG